MEDALAGKLGDYEIGTELRREKWGIVYRARDTRLERDVAVKIFSGPNEEEALHRFRLEARVMAHLLHGNLLQAISYEENEGIRYLVTQLVEDDLERRLASEPPPLAEALSILVKVCRGLASLHEKEIVHHDIKPSSILLGPDGVVKIGDLGSVGWLAASGATSQLVGTFGYMAPEQILGQPFDRRSDIYSVGVLLFELLTHRRLFDSDNIQENLFAQLHRATPRLADSPVLQSILDRTICVDRRDRYSSVAELRAVLEEASASIPTASMTLPLSAGTAPD